MIGWHGPVRGRQCMASRVHPAEVQVVFAIVGFCEGRGAAQIDGSVSPDSQNVAYHSVLRATLVMAVT